MASAIVGREAELAAVERFLDSLQAGSAALVIEGEAGIGKTTVWREAVRGAEARSLRVLQARPAESEAKLSYAALADLVGDAFDEARAALPSPQERALAAALLRTEPDEAADPRTTATALVGVLRELSGERPLVVAVDDVQWLDAASSRALEFAARRLPPRVGLLVTRRGEAGEEAPLGLGRALSEDRLQRVVPQPLSLASLHHLIASELGRSLTRPLLVRIGAACGGNPFFALEIARVLPSDESDLGLGDPLPVPANLQELVAARVRALPDTAQKAVLIVAALFRPTVATLAATFPSESDAFSALLAAEEAGILLSDGERLRFTHPLLASAVYGATSHSRRRQLHRRLAEVAADPEERARHLAASVTEPDEATAAEVEHGGGQAALRGAQDAAAELFEASCRLTPTDRLDELARRLSGVATALQSVDDLAGRRLRAERAVAASSSPAMRVESLFLLATIEWDAGAIGIATEHLETALVEASGIPELEGRALAYLSFVELDPQRAIEHADAATRLLSEEREPGLLAWVLIDRFCAAPEAGHAEGGELLERGLELEARAGPSVTPGLGRLPHPLPLIWFQCVDDFEAARARHAMEDQWYRDIGEERSRGERLAYLALAELRAGQWDLAEQYIETSCRTIEQLDVRGPRALPLSFRSLVDAHRGRVERARATLLPLIEETEQTKAAPWAALLLSALGFVEFAASEHEAVDRALRRMRQQLDSSGAKETLLDRSEPFHIESLLALGELDRARATLERLEERSRTLPRLWIDVTLPRARALVLAAEGDVSTGLAALDDLDVAAASQLPFELAWAWLVKGRLLRRQKQRRAAGEALRDALEIFERLGAPAWAEQTRSELALVAPRRRAPGELTATELRVAELAAAGLTNREVAKEAFISAKTVEANLARVYRKLGIHSRAELGARMRDHVSPTETET